jgi:hypothetical protein
VIGFGWYHLLTGDEESKEISLAAWRNVEKRKTNPKGQYNKVSKGFVLL